MALTLMSYDFCKLSDRTISIKIYLSVQLNDLDMTKITTASSDKPNVEFGDRHKYFKKFQ